MKNGKLADLDFADRFTYRKNVPFGEKELRSAGAKFQVVVFGSGKSIAPHHHEKTVEIFFIHSGKGKITLNGEEHPLASGDFFLCEPGDTHAFENCGDTDLVVLIFKTNEGGGKDIFWD